MFSILEIRLNPYARITWIRFEGIISASCVRHPFDVRCYKGINKLHETSNLRNVLYKFNDKSAT